jgi:hypothetical protein
LVDFKQLFIDEIFGLEIWHYCFFHKDHAAPKISW